jgi:glycosyltransferase involved in cell wall biosynthesis
VSTTEAGLAQDRAVPPGGGPTSGVNVIGFFRAEFGHGEAGRRILAGIERAGIPHATIAVKTPHHREKHSFTARGDRPIYPTNVVCLNPEHMLEFAQLGGGDLFLDRYTIAVWCWEASRFPDSFFPAFDLVDEIWVASDYVAEIVADATDKPVHVFPMPVEVGPPPELTRAAVGLPEDRFIFLFAFDFFSTLERKNPFGLIEAFTRAFAPGEGPVLVIKTINGSKQPGELRRLRRATADHPDIRIVEEYVTAEHMRGLVANCDCFVSLHRSEGFGFSLAEALAYEKPVIATRYSGNLTFMNDADSYLVGFGLTPVPPGSANYPAGALWADPDLDDAAAAMRRVVEHPDEARERGRRGRETILDRHSLDRTAAFVSERLADIKRRPPKERGERSTVERAARFLAIGPSLSWTAPSGRFGRFGVLARRVLLRVLRPFLVRQREWESLVVDALRQGQHLALEQRKQIERLDALAGGLQQSLDRIDARLDRLDEELDILAPPVREPTKRD